METISVHQSKNSETVSMFIELSVEKLSQYCSEKYAKRIIAMQENGLLWGMYFTNSGMIRATFI
jgi:hypothetical protein